MWEVVSSWFTPTTLFFLLNLMIATIFVSSSFKPVKQAEKRIRVRESDPVQLFRVPSLLERVKSINFSRYPAEQRDPFVAEQGYSGAPSLLERVKSMNLSRYRAEQPDPFPAETRYAEPSEERDENSTNVVESMKDDDDDEGEMESHVARSVSDKCLEIPLKGPEKMKKSASEKMDVEKEVDPRRPATTRMYKGKWNETVSFGGDEAVDEKADDFINRFKQQLKLQRIDSLLRYRRK